MFPPTEVSTSKHVLSVHVMVDLFIYCFKMYDSRIGNNTRKEHAWLAPTFILMAETADQQLCNLGFINKLFHIGKGNC